MQSLILELNLNKEKKMNKNPLSFQLKVDDFVAASASEKESLTVMRESVGFWKDGLRRFKKNNTISRN